MISLENRFSSSFAQPLNERGVSVTALRTRAFARAALVGNPSDGYHGKTISLIVRNFCAEVILDESPALEVFPAHQEQCRFDSLDDFLRDLRLNGYYGGMRLIKASIKRFLQWCAREGIVLPRKNFTLRYSSNIPRQVGLAGSSAIVTATLRALFEFYGVVIRKELLPALILAVETEELGITAGLQDRVVQVYEGLTYMDFDAAFMQAHGHGQYEALDPALVPPLYIAYQRELAESSEVVHNDIRRRFLAGDVVVIERMQALAALASEARECLLTGNHVRLAQLINRNFDIRCSMVTLNPDQARMVETARNVGASANFTGSGGAIIGTYEDEAMLERLRGVFSAQKCSVFEPLIVS